jgi:hypothetical protein
MLLPAGKFKLPSVPALVAGFSLLICLWNAPAAHAALGGDVVSVLADQGQMQGSRKTMKMDSYTVHAIQAANGTVVNEYESAEGNVFAVAWHGPFMPDMRQILGSYYDQYAQARQAQNGMRKGRHPIVINEPGLVVLMGGHPHSFAGKAYVPGKLPPGMRTEDIQ